MTLSPFIHLKSRTSYSPLEGAIKIGEVISLCKENDMPAVAITDSANLFGSMHFSMDCAKAGIQPIIGCILRISSDNANDKEAEYKLPVLVQNEAGYNNLLKLVSISYIENEEKPSYLSFHHLAHYSEGLIALSGGVDGMIEQALITNRREEAEKNLHTLAEIFKDRFYIELNRHGLDAQKNIEESLIELAYANEIPLVATNDVYFSDRDMFEAHDALMCIASGRLVEDDDRPKLNEEYYFKSGEEMQELFSDIPEAIENTVNIAKRCGYMSPCRKPLLPSSSDDDLFDEEKEFERLAREGLDKRLEATNGGVAPLEEYKTRLEYELGIIKKMEFPGYFLIVSDFIRWAKKHDIPVGPGRGSGAGSVVAWALEITDLDPLKYGLIFERFLNPERVSMPDFDIDFCQERRAEVIHYVQEKYGADKVAQIITFGKLQSRIVLRDVGRVLNMPYGKVDRISKLIPFNPANPVNLAQAIELEPQLQEEIDNDEEIAKMVEIGLKLEGLNRHCGTHAAGVVIGDRQLDELLPLYKDPNSDMPVVQYSMKYAEEAGLVKFDFLGLKTLSVIAQTVKFIKRRDIIIDIAHLPENDEKTYKMLSKGDSMGVFQLESSGMQDVLQRMKPDTLEDIIALVSLYRPGPMDNIPTYIACKHGKEKPNYMHPLMENILKETFGVIIYQEQVMEVAQKLGGYTLGGADILRRAMGKKIHAEMEKQREVFVSGSVKNNIDKGTASGIFDLIAKFAGYGFNKSHAAAYAVISYQTAYLKAHYPVEFFAASMNYDMGNTDKLGAFIEEAKKNGIDVLPPDINKSYAYFAVEDGAIRYALGALKNVGIEAVEEMVRIREGVIENPPTLSERV